MRLEGPSETLWEAYPEELRELTIVVTELGSAEAAVVILALFFWLTRRHDTTLVVTYALAGGFLILALKTYLEMPRPDVDPLIAGDRDDPYGFPSGHAYFATVLYGGLLLTFDKFDRRDLVVGVGGLVVLIGLSRVVLRVHYLGDILVGGLLGVAVLVGMHRIIDGDLRRGFAIATVLGVGTLTLSIEGSPVQVLASDVVPELWLICGLAVGGLLACGYVERLPALRSRREGAVVTAVGLAWIVAVIATGEVLAPEGGPIAGVLGAALLAGILVIPAAVGRLELGILEPDTVQPS